MQTMRRSLAVLFALVVCLSGSVSLGEESERTEEQTAAERSFTLEVLPLLQSKCFACHGDPAGELKGKLDLTTRARMLQGGESGKPAIVPGRPDESLLLQAIRWESLEMPPKQNDRLTAPQIKVMERWISAGVPWPDETAQKRIRAAERSHVENADGVIVSTSGGLSEDWTYRRYAPEHLWALRPFVSKSTDGETRQVTSPSPAKTSHPIDHFVNERLKSVGLASAERADRRTLARRAEFNLTGLPPTADDVAKFEADDSPGAWQRLIERLLASPHYGERMAQHWLDVVRYADTSGYSNDFERPHAWRYRDYVIRAFNEDRPFDRFITEQITGDELEPGNPELRVAVGYLRMGPWEHTGMSVAAVTRQLWLDDVTNSIGETFLGHALRCAQCHDHKFDPIPTRDYYRVQAVFAATQFAEPQAEFLESENRSGADERLAEWARQLGDETLVPTTDLEGDNALERIQKKLEAYRKLALARFDPKALSVKNAEPETTAILIGGSLESPGAPVTPGVLSAVAGEHPVPETRQGRRLALARWIASADNPLTARVIVNRVWQWHFGQGLVATPNNFGKTGAKPSHPELLDYLAEWFIENGWSLKKLHRLIMTSDAYQRAGEHPQPEQLARLDPNEELLARFAPRRLTAEELRDAMLAATGELSPEMGGPGVFPEINWEVALQPRHIMGGVAPSYRPSLRPQQRNRRTIYIFRYRGLSNPLLEVFNRPNPDLSCERRDETTVPTQALALLNGQFTYDRAVALAARATDQEPSEAGRFTAVFRMILGRDATAEELRAAQRHVATMQEHHAEQPPPRSDIPELVAREMIAEQTGVPFRWSERLLLDGYRPDLKASDVDRETRALAELCLVLLNSSEFLYVY